MKQFVGACLREMRIKSWLKNLFVFFPIIFSLELFDVSKLVMAVILTVSFCMVSSAIYVLNDLSDIEKDRKHEIKRHRPIASGQISMPAAKVMLVGLSVMGFGLAFLVNGSSLLLVLCYFVINILYSKWLKHIVVIDCFCIAAGFVLRVMVGGTIVEAGVSAWMFLTVLSFSLFMAFGKRRGELHSYAGGKTREVLEAYDKNFLDGLVLFCAGIGTVFYSLWSISHDSKLVYSVPFVLFVVIRYLYLVFTGRHDTDPTTLILSDITLWLSCIVCGLIMVAMLYAPMIL